MTNYFQNILKSLSKPKNYLVIISFIVLFFSFFISGIFSHNYQVSYDSYESLLFLNYPDSNLRSLGKFGDDISIRQYNRIGHSISMIIINSFFQNTSIEEKIEIVKIIDRILLSTIVFSIFWIVRIITKNLFRAIFASVVFLFIGSTLFYSNAILSDVWGLALLSYGLFWVYFRKINMNNIIGYKSKYILFLPILFFSLLTLFRFEYIFYIFLLYILNFINKKLLIYIVLTAIFLNILCLYIINGHSWYILKNLDLYLYIDDILIFVVIMCSILLVKFFSLSMKIKTLLTIAILLMISSISINFYDEKSNIIIFLINSCGLILIYYFELFSQFQSGLNKSKNENFREYFFPLAIVLTFALYHSFYLQHLSVLYFFVAIYFGLFIELQSRRLKLFLYSGTLIIFLCISWYFIFFDFKTDIAQIMAKNIPQEFVNESKSEMQIFTYFPIASFIYSNISSNYIGDFHFDFCTGKIIPKSDKILVITFQELDPDCIIFANYQYMKQEIYNTHITYTVRFDNINSNGYQKIFYYLFSKKEL